MSERNNVIQVYKPRNINGNTSYMDIVLKDGYIHEVSEGSGGERYTIQFKITATDFNDFKRRAKASKLWRD